MTNPKYVEALSEFDKGNVRPLLAIGIRAGFSNEVCHCTEPELEGRSLMCRECLHENQAQVQRLEQLMREPHPFEERSGKQGLALEMCGLCSGWRNDPRHGGME